MPEFILETDHVSVRPKDSSWNKFEGEVARIIRLQRRRLSYGRLREMSWCML